MRIGNSRGPALAPAAQEDHAHAKHQHDDAPPKIDIDAQGAIVDGLAAHQSKAHQQQSEDQEEQSQGHADVEFHLFSFIREICYMKIMFNSTTMASAITARISGR